ncbi:hypothetical protein C7T35_33765 [Variovorax sp. WS11]|uniref:hypothetical protein n=1 Tax=Variovorax sp. WS11 TaxID=1105204 RepID=UPI000D0CFDA0|nr:hypothetical protein [Variovorax sp. WS11]NDZ13845.1 hypothetical protein [Variovorax sp. WS11]PSL80154.1 hypothetical protein C7T35_33765 [Variovorax sp. WS11]
MRFPWTSALLPQGVWALLATYFLASLAHFTHNAEYIAYYPNMPLWITRETVYLVWLAVTSVGVAGLALSRSGWPFLGAVALAAYGAFGLDGLGHYTLALCAEHTWAMNLSIWAEAVAGLGLALACTVFASRLFAARARAASWRGPSSER